MSDPTAVTDEDVLKRFSANPPQEVTDQDVLSRFGAGQQSDAPVTGKGLLKAGLSGAAIGAAELPSEAVGLWNLAKRGYHQFVAGDAYDPATQDAKVPQVFQDLEDKAKGAYTPQNTAERITQGAAEYAPALVGGPEAVLGKGVIGGAKVMARRALNQVAIPQAASSAASAAAEGTQFEPYAGAAGALVGGGIGIKRGMNRAAADAEMSALNAKPLSPEGQALHDAVSDAQSTAQKNGGTVDAHKDAFRDLKTAPAYQNAPPAMQQAVDNTVFKPAAAKSEAGTLALLSTEAFLPHGVPTALLAGRAISGGVRSRLANSRAASTAEDLRLNLRRMDNGPPAPQPTPATPPGPATSVPSVPPAPQPWQGPPPAPPTPQVAPLNPAFIKQMQAQAKMRAAAPPPAPVAPAPVPGPTPAPQVAPLNPAFLKQMQAEAKMRAAAPPPEPVAPAPMPGPPPAPPVAPLNPMFLKQMQAEAKARQMVAAQASPPQPQPAPVAPPPAPVAPAPAPVAPPAPAPTPAPVAAPTPAPAPIVVPPQVAQQVQAAQSIKKVNGKVKVTPAPAPAPAAVADVKPTAYPAPADEHPGIPDFLRRDLQQAPAPVASPMAAATKAAAPFTPEGFMPLTQNYKYAGMNPEQIGKAAEAASVAKGGPAGVVGPGAQAKQQIHFDTAAKLKDQFPDDAAKLEGLRHQLTHITRGGDVPASTNFAPTVDHFANSMSPQAAKAVRETYNSSYKEKVWPNRSGKKKPKTNG